MTCDRDNVYHLLFPVLFIDQDENRTISLIPLSVADQLSVILDSLFGMCYNYPRVRVLLVCTYPYIF